LSRHVLILAALPHQAPPGPPDVLDAHPLEAHAHAGLDADGTVVVQSATHDVSTGTYTSITSMTQIAADALGPAARHVTFRLGDSTMAPAPPQGASQTTASVGPVAQDTCDKLRQQAIKLAVEDERSPLHGVDADGVVVRGGRLHVKGSPARGETYRQLLARNDRTHLEARGSWTPEENSRFNEVVVDWPHRYLETTQLDTRTASASSPTTPSSTSPCSARPSTFPSATSARWAPAALRNTAWTGCGRPA
jgi:CO/xanthine dehydrogenase Mo-binding subunit